jgi:hypothetical protein
MRVREWTKMWLGVYVEDVVDEDEYEVEKDVEKVEDVVVVRRGV